MSAVLTPVEVFCSYAHEDEAWFRKLETLLSLLKRQGLLSLWHDRLISPGTDWAQTIDTRLETASVILLLVSADFFASNYCAGLEMKRALERQEAGEAQVIPILVRPVDWTDALFAHLQVLPTDAKPLANWRNQDRALTDVATSLRHVIEDMSLLAANAPRAALPVIWNIPFPRNPFFLGRENELAQLHQQLQVDQATALSQPQAISGLGGIGKTQLALEYAYRYHHDYQVILWARAESKEALISSYVAIATLLRLPECEAKEHDMTVQAVKNWLQTHRGWLLILDNADELAQLADFLPPVRGGHVLLTTQAAATGRLAHRLEIETLLPDQGALFLLRRAGLISPDAELLHAPLQERELALQMNQELGGLPLALDQAGAYLEESGMNLVAYWQMYQQHRADLFKQRGGLVADHPDPVATIWSLSFDKVQKTNPASAELLQLCAFLAPDAIAEEILTTGASFLGPILQPVTMDAFLLSQAIEVLRTYSLVRRDPREKTLSIHRLLQAILQDTLEQKEQRLWAERAVLAVNAVFPHPEYETWPQCERLLAQALRAKERIVQYHVTILEASRLLFETASYLKDRARYSEAEPLYLRALHIREQHLGPEHFDVASPLIGLADLYRKQSKYAQAEPLFQRALHIREQQLGPEHLRVASPLIGLAILYKEQGKYAQAEPLYQRVLHIREQQLGPEHPDVVPPLIGLADLYRMQGKYAQAEPLLQRALCIQEQHLGSEHPKTAETIHDLARLREAQDNNEEASVLYARALAVREQSLGGQHPKTRETRTRFVSLLHTLGQHEKAAQLECVQPERVTNEEGRQVHSEE